jgi:hypothetical protein
VAQGLLFYLDSDDRPTEITLTGLYNNFGEKLHCIAVTRSTFACSIEGTLLAHYGDDQDEWQANSQGSGGSGSLGHGPNDNDPTTHLVNGSVSLFGAVNLVQTVNLANDPPAEPSSVPEPGSLMLLAGALLSLRFARRRVQRLG